MYHKLEEGNLGYPKSSAHLTSRQSACLVSIASLDTLVLTKTPF